MIGERHVRLPVALGAALASSLLLWGASPAIGFGELAWVALVPAASAWVASPGSVAGSLAVPLATTVYLELLLVPAFPFGLMDNQWGDPAIPIVVGDSPVLFVSLVAVPVVGGLMYLLGFPHLLGRRRAAARAALVVLLPAAGWTAFDLLRTKLDPSGLWGPLYLTQEGLGTARLAALAGPWLVTFAIVSVNYAAAALLVRGRPALATAIPVAAATSAAVLAAPLAIPDGDRPLRVAAVQPGYDTAEYELPALASFRPEIRDLEQTSLDLVDDLAGPTRAAAAQGATLVVWPEATAWVDPRQNPAVRAALAALARSAGTAIVVPYFLDDVDQGHTVAVRADGTFSTAQPKLRPMWFLGEKGVPDRAARPLSAGPVTVGVMLGVDNQDTLPARSLVVAGATLITSSTHDWAQLAPHQRAFSRLHAAALGAPLVRSDWRYGSAIVDRDGDLVASAGARKRRTVLVADVRPSGGPTPYTTVGDAFGWAAAAVALGGIAGGLAQERRDGARRRAIRRSATEG